MLMTQIGDPRLAALPGAIDPRGAGVRPIIRLPGKGLSPLGFALIASAFGAVAVLGISERRPGQDQPAVGANTARPDRSLAAPPPLYIPPEDSSREPPYFARSGIAASTGGSALALRPRPYFDGLPAPRVVAPPFAGAGPSLSTGAPMMFDRAPAAAASRPILGVADGLAGSQSAPEERVQSSVLADPSMTVAQGSLIPAVLETGFDSSASAYVRAIVSRDVRSFDGGKVLIPRGSRLIGESKSTPVEGQTRASITWTRLIRPDGTTIEMHSPTTDLVGNGGVAASVKKHSGGFGDTLAKAIVGLSRIASRVVGGPLVVMSGNGSSFAPQVNSRPSRPPTLKVAPGTSINVFVAHDLDFSAAGAARE